MLFTIVVSSLLVAADQFTKYLAVTHLAPVGTMPLIPGVIQLQFILNDGMAFSLLSGSRWLLVTVTGIALLALLIYPLAGLFWGIKILFKEFKKNNPCNEYFSRK